VCDDRHHCAAEGKIAFPTDSRLDHPGRENPGAACRQTWRSAATDYHRLGKRALRLANHYGHARQMRRARREIK
jgi:IS5 family transposase